MCNLIIDEGNTRCKAYVFDNEDIIAHESASLLSDSLLVGLAKQHNISKIISSSTRRETFVVPQELQHIAHTRLDSHTPLPIAIDYKTPETLGHDRIAAAVGANRLFPKTNVLIIDIGTAITFDFVDSSATFHGGTISPGAAMRAQALNHFTGRLPLVSVPHQSNLQGKSTDEALQYGIANGVRFEIDAYINKYKCLYSNLQVVVTGGGTEFFDYLYAQTYFEPNLVAIGLNTILEHATAS